MTPNSPGALTLTPKTPGAISLAGNSPGSVSLAQRTQGSLDALYPKSVGLYPSTTLYPSSSAGLASRTPGALTLTAN